MTGPAQWAAKPEVPATRPSQALEAVLAHPPRCLALAELPTPVERASWLDGPGAEVWIKRDDSSSPIYGGGKVRKLEWVLANPPFDDDRPIVSVGAIGSHHLVALALYLEAVGRELHALSFDQVPTAHVCRNLAVLVSSGTRLWHVRTRVRLPWSWLSYHLWRRPSSMGCFMTPGASTAVGGLGFVAAGLELAAQIDTGLLPSPRTIYLTAGTAGTAAGLALGLALARRGTHLRLVSAVERIGFNATMLHGRLRSVFALMVRHGLVPEFAGLGASGLLRSAGVSWSIDHRWVGSGYGHPTPAASDAVECASAHGLALETTYTGKCLAALRHDLQRPDAELGRGSVLFWNTHAGNDLSGRIRPGWEQRLPPALWRRLRATTVVPDLIASPP